MSSDLLDAHRLIDDPDAAVLWGKQAGLNEPSIAHRAMVHLAQQGLTFDLLTSIATHLREILPKVSAPDRVLTSLERFFVAVRSPLSAGTLFQRDPRSLLILARLFSASPYLTEIVIQDPHVWEKIRLGDGRPEKKELMATTLLQEIDLFSDNAAAMDALRRFKRQHILRIAYGDIVLSQRLEVVTSQISHLADCVIDAALHVALKTIGQRCGLPTCFDGTPATLTAIALGKLGGRELNYSSDIDMVFICSGDGLMKGATPYSTVEFFERVIQEFIHLVSDVTPLGHAYRVDLRLRPFGTNGPLVMTSEQLLQYYDKEGRTWERQAWVKARCVAGDSHLGAYVLDQLQPWIYRRFLSSADINGIKSLKREIEYRASQSGGDGCDVKHGHGGIRDIEFTIQFLQLLNGGTTSSIRTGNTLEAIGRLTETGSLTDQERAILEKNYRLLRTVEHRIQVLNDIQTHRLPQDGTERERLAAELGFGSGAAGRTAMESAIEEATRLNRKILDHILHDAFPGEEKPEPEVDLILNPQSDTSLIKNLISKHGFRDAERTHQLLHSLSEEGDRFLSSHRCRHFLAAIAPRLLTTVGKTHDPDTTLANLNAIANSIGGKSILWELFSASPPSLDLMIRLCSTSPFLSRLLVSNPGMIDELVDSLLLDHLPTQDFLNEYLCDLCKGATGILPILQSFKVSQQLRVGMRDILGHFHVDEIAQTLTAIAEATLRATLAHEETKLVARFGEPAGGTNTNPRQRAEMIVLALGKFGGQEMNYASDLDVVFVYDQEGETCKTGQSAAFENATTHAHFFSELSQKTMRTLNTFTPQGRLYETDSRLRPSGRSGPVAISIKEFGRYFQDDGPAAIWERQALTKARIIFGAKQSRHLMQRIIDDATYERTWSKEDLQSIYNMRHQMEENTAPRNLKRGRGGVVDIEFIAQALQLRYGKNQKHLRATGTHTALTELHNAGHLSKSEFSDLSSAYDFLRLIEGRLRLIDATARHDFPSSPDEQRNLAALLGYRSASALSSDVQRITTQTRNHFESIFSESLIS